MTLIKYNPLNDFVPGTFGDLLENVLQQSNNEATYMPAVDILKNEKELVLQLMLPGIKKEDINIDLNDNKLVISGERKAPEGVEFKKQESRYGDFRRTFTLSEEINQEAIDAKYADGILNVHLPLVAKKEKTVIKIK